MEMETCTSIILLGFIFILTILFLYMKRAHEFFNKHGICGPKPARMFGIFKDYKTRGIAETDIDLISKYGKVVGIYHGHKPVLLVADPVMIESICIRNFDKFRNRKLNFDMGPLLRKTVALSNDGQWKFLREQISKVFAPNYLNRITEKLLESTSHLYTNIDEKLQTERDFDFQELCLAYSVDSLCNSLFGHNVNSYRDNSDRTVTMIKKGWKAGTQGVVKPATACGICPAVATILSTVQYNAIPYDVRNYLTALVTKKMEERHTQGDRNDMLSFIMHTSRRQSVVVDSQNNRSRLVNISSGYRLSETEIVANCLFFFLAGYDTTASTIVFTLYCLAKNPDCQDRLFEEIDRHISKSGLSYDAIAQLDYLDMVLNESMRIFPTYLRFNRSVEEDIIIRGTQFVKGTEVSFPIYAIHRDPDIYPSPEKFDPYRFSEENVTKRHPMSFIPFGVGPRDCFGQSYAKLSVKLALVTLLQKFRFSLSQVKQDPPALNKGMYLRPENGLWLSVDHRETE